MAATDYGCYSQPLFSLASQFQIKPITFARGVD